MLDRSTTQVTHLLQVTQRVTQYWCTGVSCQHRVIYVQEGVRTGSAHRDRVGRSQWAFKNPGTSFVDRVACYEVATSSGWRARIVQVDAILAAAVDDIALHRISIATNVDGIEGLGSTDMVRLDGRAVSEK